MSAASWTQLSELFRELQRLTAAQQPLPVALQAVAGALRHGRMTQALDRVRAQVDDGTPLHEATAAEAVAFPEPISALIAAGLAADDLPAMLSVVAEHCESEARLRREMRGVLAYPAVTLAICMMIAVLAGGGPVRNADGVWTGTSGSLAGFLGVFKLQGSFEYSADPGYRGPLMSVVSSPWGMAVLLLLFGVAAWAIARWMVRSLWWRAHAARLVWRLPGAGPVYRASVSARFLATFARLMRAGVPVERTGELLAQLFPFAPVSDAVRELRERVEEGGAALDGVKPSPLVPASVAWLVAGGETRGDLPGALAQAAELQRDRADRSAKTLRALWGPLVQLITGVLVFLLIVIVLTPLGAYYANTMMVMGQARAW